MAKLFANSGDPDQMPHSVASDLGLHYANFPFRCLDVFKTRQVTSCPKSCFPLQKDGKIFQMNPFLL